MVRDVKTGKPLHRPASNVGPCNVLDFTVPEALKWLRGVVRTMVRDWKVGYIKLDGPALGHYKGGVFRDPDITTVQQVRRSLEVIREECGEDVLLEGEGIYGPSIGLVDIQRTMQDNWPYWYSPKTGGPAMKENMKNDLLRSFMHGKFWHNHRENVILRDFLSPFHHFKETYPNSKDVVLPENELLFQLSAATMSGGAMLLTDPMDQLVRNPRKIELISRFLPHYEEASCRPLDTFCGGRQPSLYYMRVRRDFEEWFVVGVFNWDDSYNDYTVPISMFAGEGSWHAFDFWHQEYLGKHKDEIPVRDVPAHGCRIMALRRARNLPQLVGTNMHILQGAVDVKAVSFDEDVLRVEIKHFMQREGRIAIWHPSRYKLDRVETNAKDYLLDARKRNPLTIHFNGRKRTSFRMKWRTR